MAAQFQRSVCNDFDVFGGNAELDSQEWQEVPQELQDLQQNIEHEDIRDVLNGRPEFDRELFIGGVRKYRCLWDTNAALYKERSSKANAWKELFVTFQIDCTESF